jgi:peroxiredoxin
MLRPWILCIALTSIFASTGAVGEEPAASEDDAVVPGHSAHGEVFNEGPRQAAYLMHGTGRVSFPVTTTSAAAQEFIDQGVGQLHGFWYFEAERSFRQAAGLDPECAIAYWGMAQANVRNEKRAKGFIAEAVERKQGVTRREAMYIDALDAYFKAGSKKDKERRQEYVKALEKILHEHPEDIEARALLALQLWQNSSKGIPISSYFAVDALMGEVFADNPMHPAHHYRIHLWDREKPERALESAALCGPAAPGIAHMWHMPGHIYSKLKRYHDAVWQQEASARVDHAHMIRDRVLPDQIHNYAHNNEWLIRNLVHIGRVSDGVSLAKNMLELPRHPKFNTLSKRGTSSAFGRTRLLEILSKFELWDELLALSETMYLEPAEEATDEAGRLRHIGRAYFALEDGENGREILARLQERLDRSRTEEDQAVSQAVLAAREAARKKLATADAAEGGDAEENSEAEDRGDSDTPAAADSVVQDASELTDEQIDQQFAQEIKKARADAAKPFADGTKALEQAIMEMQGHIAMSGDDLAEGVDLLKQADFDPLLLAHLQVRSGQTEEAEKAVQKQITSRKNEVLPLAHLVQLHWSLDQREKAGEAFDRLRELSAEIDLEAPPFARLAPIAAELGYPSDWRIGRTAPDDIGERPDLDSLGPLRWHPSPAPAWTLTDVSGQPHSLADYKGKPVVVIFYLGYGCLHCAEQLQAFAPTTEEFAEAGLSLIAISTDEQAFLQKSIDDYGSDFPFPLVSDAEFEVFRSYRAYDDFEQQPLHGTFLIDGEGLVRWQDIGHEPFMDPDFVLNEARRLLDRTHPPATTAAQPAARPGDEKAAEEADGSVTP